MVYLAVFTISGLVLSALRVYSKVKTEKKILSDYSYNT